MTVPVTILAVVYDYPQTGDTEWGGEATGAFVALAGATLQKTGGSFGLTAEVDFGALFGLKSIYFKTGTALPATTGVLRLANTDSICFRNFANDGNLCLLPNASNELTWNGSVALPTLTNPGDLITFDGSDNVAFPVGTDGYLLIANSAEPSGLEWIPPGPAITLADPGGNGVVVRTAISTTVARTLTGTADQISIADGTGVAGNPTFTIANNVVLPGTGSMTVVSGTTAQQPAGSDGQLRFDTDTNKFVGYDGSWKNVATEDYVGAGFQPLDSDLTALAALATTGLLARTGSGTVATRTVTAPASGITVSNGDGVAGNPTLALADDLAALEALSSIGIAVRSGAATWVQRSLTQPADGIIITNGDGVLGNIIFSLADDLAALEALGSTGFAVRTASDTWAQRTFSSPNTALTITNGTGVSGNPVFTLDSDLDAIAALSGTGIAVRSASNTWVQRSVASTSSSLVVTNGDGVSGNMSLSLDADLQSIGTLDGAQGDMLYATGANTWSKLAKNTTASRYLSNTGGSNNPAWAQVNLTNGVTGVLPIANGGSNATTTAPLFKLTMTASGAGTFFATWEGVGDIPAHISWNSNGITSAGEKYLVLSGPLVWSGSSGNKSGGNDWHEFAHVYATLYVAGNTVLTSGTLFGDSHQGSGGGSVTGSFVLDSGFLKYQIVTVAPAPLEDVDMIAWLTLATVQNA